jgi:hypothetical protein
VRGWRREGWGVGLREGMGEGERNDPNIYAHMNKIKKIN